MRRSDKSGRRQLIKGRGGTKPASNLGLPHGGSGRQHIGEFGFLSRSSHENMEHEKYRKKNAATGSPPRLGQNSSAVQWPNKGHKQEQEIHFCAMTGVECYGRGSRSGLRKKTKCFQWRAFVSGDARLLMIQTVSGYRYLIDSGGSCQLEGGCGAHEPQPTRYKMQEQVGLAQTGSRGAKTSVSGGFGGGRRQPGLYQGQPG